LAEETMSVIAMVCARKGSKRIENKPFQEIGGWHLLDLAIDKARLAKVHRTVLLTDFLFARKGKRPYEQHLRPDHLNGDDVPKWHVWRWFAEQCDPDDILVDVDLCRPFSTYDEIDGVLVGIEATKDMNRGLSMSGARAARSPYQDILVRNATGWAPLPCSVKGEPSYLSDHTPDTYDHGGVVAMRAGYIRQYHPFHLGAVVYPDPHRNVIDINTPEDLEYCRWLASASNSKTSTLNTSSRTISSIPHRLSEVGLSSSDPSMD
jgi:CMP-N-acetylneuraminic acid synthetase